MRQHLTGEPADGCPEIDQIGNGLYSKAPEVEEFANELIRKYHPHLEGVKICYLFRSDQWMVRKVPVRGRVSIAPPLWQHIGGFELIVVINKAIFESLSADGRLVIVDNELSSVEEVRKETGKKSWRFRKQDICEYSDVLARHNICVSNMVPVVKGELVQMSIFDSIETQVIDPKKITDVYKPVEIEDEEPYFTEDYEEMIRNDPRYDGLR